MPYPAGDIKKAEQMPGPADPRPEVRSGCCSILQKIADSFLQEIDRILEAAEPLVAGSAKQPANLSGAVAMIDHKR